jgi:hypothetical protein
MVVYLGNVIVKAVIEEKLLETGKSGEDVMVAESRTSL